MPPIQRLATYNLHQGAARGAAAGLLADWQPDVFCLQETRDPALLLGVGEPVPGVIWEPVPGHSWGSGLVVRGEAATIPLPPDLVGSWKTKEGLTRVEALPRGDPNDNETLRRFASAVLAAEPTAIGGPVSILKSGELVVRAFIEAGVFALVVISLLLWLTLRRITDVLLTLVPLLVAGAVTLEICVLIELPLNFANIVALPLLLGVGVAFKIYYVTAWRSGRTNLLQSSLTRAIFFSALTTATAFGSLWLSSHPGTSSMGKLLALSLLTTLAAVLLFQPALMGKPRDIRE